MSGLFSTCNLPILFNNTGHYRLSEAPSKAVPASTILVLRDQPHSLEVLLHQRALKIPAFPGYYVYPGGKVDAEDNANYTCALSHQALQQSSNHSGQKQIPAVEYWVAAIRELFEETGILLARDCKGEALWQQSEPFTEQRDAINTKQLGFFDFCQQQQLSLATDQLHYFCHWVTPTRFPYRFDTRFFIAHIPLSTSTTFDSKEANQEVWISPHQAIKQFQDGDLDMILPTSDTLESIAQFNDVKSLLKLQAKLWPDMPLLPKIKKLADGTELSLLPVDDGYNDQGVL